jgi:hypothetical protein
VGVTVPECRLAGAGGTTGRGCGVRDPVLSACVEDVALCERDGNRVRRTLARLLRAPLVGGGAEFWGGWPARRAIPEGIVVVLVGMVVVLLLLLLLAAAAVAAVGGMGAAGTEGWCGRRRGARLNGWEDIFEV